jgi:hypothetical protein
VAGRLVVRAGLSEAAVAGPGARLAVGCTVTADRPKAQGSAYGTGAPTYDDAERQRKALDGRLKVAMSCRDHAPDPVRRAKWARIVDELLDRRLEVRGR